MQPRAGPVAGVGEVLVGRGRGARFGDYVVARSRALGRHRAEDAVQAAFAKVYLRRDKLAATRLGWRC